MSVNGLSDQEQNQNQVFSSIEADFRDKGYCAETIGHTVHISKYQYLDNGYGFYFYAEIYGIYDPLRDIYTALKVDNMNEKEIDKALDGVISRCDFMEKFDECFKSLDPDQWIDKALNLDPPCLECQRLSMIQSLLSGLWSSGL